MEWELRVSGAHRWDASFFVATSWNVKALIKKKGQHGIEIEDSRFHLLGLLDVPGNCEGRDERWVISDNQ